KFLAPDLNALLFFEPVPLTIAKRDLFGHVLEEVRDDVALLTRESCGSVEAFGMLPPDRFHRSRMRLVRYGDSQCASIFWVWGSKNMSVCFEPVQQFGCGSGRNVEVGCQGAGGCDCSGVFGDNEEMQGFHVGLSQAHIALRGIRELLLYRP